MDICWTSGLHTNLPMVAILLLQQILILLYIWEVQPIGKEFRLGQACALYAGFPVQWPNISTALKQIKIFKNFSYEKVLNFLFSYGGSLFVQP
jgi:hypothetical protein